jgi:hypothetical protein
MVVVVVTSQQWWTGNEGIDQTRQWKSGGLVSRLASGSNGSGSAAR